MYLRRPDTLQSAGYEKRSHPTRTTTLPGLIPEFDFAERNRSANESFALLRDRGGKFQGVGDNLLSGLHSVLKLSEPVGRSAEGMNFQTAEAVRSILLKNPILVVQTHHCGGGNDHARLRFA